jgi:hypothetical protein
LSRAEFAHNSSVHNSTGETSFFLNSGSNPRTPPGEKLDRVHPASVAFVERWQSALTFARKCLIAAQQRQKAYADQRLTDRSFSEGDKVLLSMKYLNFKRGKRSRKLLPKWIGPLEIEQVVGPVAYKLKMNLGWRIHPVFHVSLLEPYRSDGRVQPPPPPIELEGAPEYEVDSILDHRFRGRCHPRAFYLVSWKGYGPEHNSWEPERYVVNAPEAVADYWKRREEQRQVLGASLSSRIQSERFSYL